MNFIPAECPNCGGKLQVPDNVEKVSCMYCKSDIILKTDHPDQSRLNVLLELLETEMRVGNFEDAYPRCNRVLELAPGNVSAWLYKGHCKLALLANYDDVNEVIGYYKHALDLAEDKAQFVESILENWVRNNQDCVRRYNETFLQSASRLNRVGHGFSEATFRESMAGMVADSEALMPRLLAGIEVSNFLSREATGIPYFSAMPVFKKQIFVGKIKLAKRIASIAEMNLAEYSYDVGNRTAYFRCSAEERAYYLHHLRFANMLLRNVPRKRKKSAFAHVENTSFLSSIPIQWWALGFVFLFSVLVICVILNN